MAVLRNQDFFEVDVTLAAGTPLAVTLPRPETTPALDDTLDHVTNPSSRRENEGGRAIIDLSDAAASTVVTKVEILGGPDTPFTDAPEPSGSAEEPLFPSGAPTSKDRVAFEDAVGVAFDEASLVAFLENLYLAASEKVRLTLLNAGAVGPFPVRVGYDLGRNATDIGLRANA